MTNAAILVKRLVASNSMRFTKIGLVERPSDRRTFDPWRPARSVARSYRQRAWEALDAWG